MCSYTGSINPGFIVLVTNI